MLRTAQFRVRAGRLRARTSGAEMSTRAVLRRFSFADSMSLANMDFLLFLVVFFSSWLSGMRGWMSLPDRWSFISSTSRGMSSPVVMVGVSSCRFSPAGPDTAPTGAAPPDSGGAVWSLRLPWWGPECAPGLAGAGKNVEGLRERGRRKSPAGPIGNA